jgi:hypothetical protein
MAGYQNVRDEEYLKNSGMKSSWNTAKEIGR